MVTLRFRGFWSLLYMLLLVMGCSHVISSEMRQAARKDLSFPAVLENPSAFIGSSIIVGGVIIETINRQGGTEVVVLETPLDPQGIPKDEEYSRGRFIAKASYLDPEIYQRGEKIAMAGEITGKQVKPVGEIQYTYPVIQAKELHLVKERPPYYWPHFSFGFGFIFH